MPKFKGSMTDSEKANFLEGNLTTQQGLENSISLVIQRKGHTADPSEMTELVIAEPALRAELSIVDSQLTAFLANSVAVDAPTKSEVDNIAELARRIAIMQATSDRANAIIGAATHLAKTWRTLSGGASA